jgi:hypothetical protein
MKLATGILPLPRNRFRAVSQEHHIAVRTMLVMFDIVWPGVCLESDIGTRAVEECRLRSVGTGGRKREEFG